MLPNFNPPSDNINKFLAYTGILVCGVTIYWLSSTPMPQGLIYAVGGLALGAFLLAVGAVSVWEKTSQAGMDRNLQLTNQKLEAEIRKLNAETAKIQAETLKITQERFQSLRQKNSA